MIVDELKRIYIQSVSLQDLVDGHSQGLAKKDN